MVVKRVELGVWEVGCYMTVVGYGGGGLGGSQRAESVVTGWPEAEC